MHRTSNCIDNSKRIKIYTYFAYRLPHENETHYLKGQLVERASITELMGRGIVFCSFQSDQIYQMESIEKVDPTEWELHYSQRENKTTSLEQYQNSFSKLSSEIESGRFNKLVLTKTKSVKLQDDPMDIFHELNRNYLNTFNYFLSSPELGCWMGASPELLCEINDVEVTAISLAGTKKSDEKWTNKEIEEQLYVTRYIKDKLKDLHCLNMKVDGPHNISAGPVQHLKTIISCTLTTKEIWRKVIEDLHPTPATCGIPAASSKEFIKETELHDRAIYTGFIGVFTEGSKKCFVNLRCMELFEKEAVLFIGGGITKDSTVEKEWEETERKAKTLERILTK